MHVRCMCEGNTRKVHNSDTVCLCAKTFTVTVSGNVLVTLKGRRAVHLSCVDACARACICDCCNWNVASKRARSFRSNSWPTAWNKAGGGQGGRGSKRHTHGAWVSGRVCQQWLSIHYVMVTYTKAFFTTESAEMIVKYVWSQRTYVAKYMQARVAWISYNIYLYIYTYIYISCVYIYVYLYMYMYIYI